MLVKLMRAGCFTAAGLYGLKALGLLPPTEAYADLALFLMSLAALIGWEAYSISDWRFGQVRQHLQTDANALEKLRTYAVEMNKERCN